MKKIMLGITAAIGLSTAASAQGVSGFYVSGSGGLNILQGNTFTLAEGVDADFLRSIGLGTDAKVTFDPGFAGVLALGWGFGNGLRLEVEGSYRRNDIDTVRLLGIGATDLQRAGVPAIQGGNQTSYGVMANVVFEATGNDLILRYARPYIGGGLGYVWTSWNDVRLGIPNLGDVRVDDTSGRFAYQAFVGAAFPIHAVAGLAITAEYRFLGTSQPEYRVDLRDAEGAVVSSDRFKADNFNHSLMLGVRYNFGQSAPAPVATAAAAPSPARTFLVFFDWNRADLTERGRQIISEAAQTRSRQRVTRIEVSGHTDTSGSANYNQGLSERRAATVAAELVRLGVPRNEIVTRGFGQSQLLVQTADNVREPQNRRVEIVLR